MYDYKFRIITNKLSVYNTIYHADLSCGFKDARCTPDAHILNKRSEQIQDSGAYNFIPII